ncbi:MAG TPA: DUF3168 domain-containing protein [Novosphingobium sp.]|nr:DUF3168 domain-containing protein [Novosphingobium sp.]
MDSQLRAALIAWLAADPVLAAGLNAVTEEAPSRSSLPWLAIASSSTADWSTKTETGYETRIALDLHCRADTPDTAASLVSAIQARIVALPRAQVGMAVIGIHFLRASAAQTSETTRKITVEYRFRVLLA